KKLQLSIASLALIFAVSCGNNAQGDKVEAGEAQKTEEVATAAAYKVDNTATTIQWKGTKAIGGGHEGTITLADGSEINVEGGKVVGGKFIFDFNTLTPTDITGGKADTLKAHLLHDDFLGAEKHPEGHFVITGVTEGAPADSKLAGATHTISGNLTLKGVEKGISFPAIVTVTENSVNAKSELFFDRTQWGINYGSDASLKDNLINKEIELKLDITANKYSGSEYIKNNNPRLFSGGD